MSSPSDKVSWKAPLKVLVVNPELRLPRQVMLGKTCLKKEVMGTGCSGQTILKTKEWQWILCINGKSRANSQAKDPPLGGYPLLSTF